MLSNMHTLDDYYDELCDLIAQMTLEKTAWLNFAKRLLAIMDVSYIHVQAIDFSYQVLSYSNGIGVRPLESYADAELDYLRYPTYADPRWGRFLDPAHTGWYQCHTHVTEEFVQQSDLYQKILLPIGLRYVATHHLILDEKLCVFFSVSTSAERQPLNQQELKFLDRLLPHLKRVMVAQRSHYEFSLDNLVGYHLIDKLPQPILLLNLSGQVVHLNTAMREILKKEPKLQLKNNLLILPAPDQQKMLEHLYKIEHVFRYQQDKLDELKEINLTVSDTALNLNLSFLVSEKERSFFGIRPLVMVSCSRIHSKIPKYYLAYDELSKQYRLSKREIEVCEWFVNGLNLEEIAFEMNITMSSIRTYLKVIFAKMQCNSQVDLLRLLMSSFLSYPAK